MSDYTIATLDDIPRRDDTWIPIRRHLDIAGAAGGPIHVDLDVDVCDRSVAPGCPASVPGGISAYELRSAAHTFASEIASSAPLALLSIRETMRGDLADRVRAATARESQEQQRLRETDDFHEAVTAVAERRAPNFTGR